MSVFRVQLNNTAQGRLDYDPATASQGNLGSQMSPSIQRGVYVTGPNLSHRLLIDGSTFTDCNYWKRFAYPQVSLADAFIEVVTDDGSIYSDVASENVFPRVYDITAAGGSTFSDNEADILGDTGGYAVFAQITNNGADPVRVRLNGLTTATFDLGDGDVQVFNTGDMAISLIQIDNSASGVSSADIQIVVSVRSVCNS